MTKKPKLTLIQGGVQTYEQYKNMINRMTMSLLGRPTTLTEEKLRAGYEKFKKKAETGQSETETASDT